MDVKDNEIERLYAETFRGIEQGSILSGRVIAIKEEGVIVDVGYKSEGIVPAEEFLPYELQRLSVGDPLDVYVESIKDSEGIVVLSKDRASKIRAWATIEACHKEDSPIEGSIVRKTKGGLFVEISGVKAFLPNSHLDIKPVKDIDSVIGLRCKFKILKLNNKRSSIVVSRKAYLEEEKLGRRTKTLEALNEGSIVKGIVKNITDYGVFIDLGGIDGLLHISDISWGRIGHPSERFSIGDTVDVIVLKYDKEAGKVTLGYKQLKPDPWEGVDEKYPVGTRIRGKVSSTTDYGAFIEVEEGLEGLVHISEIDWAPRPKHPSKYLKVGDEVEAVVLKVDKNERRLSLSIKQTKPSPWKLVSENYKVGQIITGKIRGITEFGAFVGLPEGVDGLIHISDLSWTRHIKHPSEVLRKGQRVEAVVLSIDPEKEKLALGIKQLKPDPWIEDIPNRFKLGDEFDCKVIKSTDFGLFVEIAPEIEGLIYSSEIVQGEEPFKEGDMVRARLIKIDKEHRKIGLSMKNVRGR